jgi:glycosyltransferase involved in cell wall biosynthesis
MTKFAIIIPCRNEEKYIEGCLKSVLEFALPSSAELDVFVVDGGSTDTTRERVQTMAKCDRRVRLTDNPAGFQGPAVNQVLREWRGDYCLWLGAHTYFPKNYVLLCYETAQRTGADVVGGFCRTEVGGKTYGAQIVQALTTHKFGVGDSNFRTSAKEGPVDTVAYALFSRPVFDKVGLLDERLVRAQDYELNCRIRRAGLKIWMNPAIQCSYHNQASLVAFYRKQFLLEAPYNAYMWYLAPYAFTPRHAITGVFALGVLGGIALSPLASWIAWPFAAVMTLYFLLAVASGAQQAIRYRQPLHAIFLPPCFFLYHFLHGLGVLWGLIRLATGTAPVQKINEPWPGAGRRRACPPTKSSAD